MDGKIKKTAVLESKLYKVRNILKNKKEERTIKEKEIEEEQKRENTLSKRKKQLILKRNSLERRAVFFGKKESSVKAEKKKIEENEKKEKNLVKKRTIEKQRWETEEKRRKIEEKKWHIEDLVKQLDKEIRNVEREITNEVKEKKKQVKRELEKIDKILKKNLSWEEFLKKEIVLAEEKEKQIRIKKEREREIIQKIRSEAKRKEEELQKEKEEREKALQEKLKEEEKLKEREIIQKIRSEAKRKEEELQKEKEEREQALQEKLKEEEKLKEKEEREKALQEKLKEEEKKNEMEKRFKELFDVIEENKKEIDSLRGELAEKEQEQKRIENEGDRNEEKKRQVDIIRERIKKEQEELKERETIMEKQALSPDFPYKKAEEKSFIDKDNYQDNDVKQQIPVPEHQPEKSSSSIPVSKEDQYIDSDNSQKLGHEEAEALFKKAEKSFYAGSMQIAKDRFQRIVDNYYPEENKSILGKIGKTLDVRAGEYIAKIDQQKEKQRGEIEDKKRGERAEDIYQKRKEIEKKIQEILKERKDIEEHIKKAEEEENLQEVARLSHQFEEIEGRRSSLERELGKSIEVAERIKEDPYTRPTVIREVIREKVQEPPRESIQEEIRRILAEKETIEKEIEDAKRKKRDEEEKAKEIKKREQELETEKEKLKEQEQSTNSEEEKQEIRRKREEMENELRRLIAEETTEKWEKRIREVENEVMRVNRKYEELTKKEEVLRDQVKEITSWGPESRKREKEVDTYRSLYGKSFSQSGGKGARKDGDPEEEKKLTKKESSSGGFLKSLKPSKDFFLKPPLLIAIDISDYSLEVFAINEQKVVVSYGRTLLKEGIVYNGEIREKEKLQKIILEVFQKAKPSPIIKRKDRRIKGAINLPESKIFVQQVKIEKNDNILDKIKKEIERTIPISIDELYFHYHEIPGSKDEVKNILCVAVEKRIINQYIDFLQSVEVDPIIFDLEAASLGRSLLSSKKKDAKEKDEKTEMIVDIGARSTNVSVFHEKVLSFSVSVPFGGAYFTERIAKKLKIDKEEAEKRKKRVGLRGELKGILSDSLDKITKEIRDVERYYNREIGGEIEKMIIVGGSSLVPGVVDYFKDEFGNIVSTGKPSEKIKTVKELDEKEILIYANVIGLALRIADNDPIESGLNVLPEEVKKTEKRYQQERRRWVWISAIAIALVGIVALFFSIYYAYGYLLKL